MESKKETTLFLDEQMYELTEISTICGIKETLLLEFVEYGILEPKGDSPPQWLFSARNVIRAQKAVRLSKDLEINLPGISLVLELLEEIEVMRQKMSLLEK